MDPRLSHAWNQVVWDSRQAASREAGTLPAEDHPRGEVSLAAPRWVAISRRIPLEVFPVIHVYQLTRLVAPGAHGACRARHAFILASTMESRCPRAFFGRCRRAARARTRPHPGAA
ncbi:hypothetical protein GQ600_17125 [Phytophthora cactorum]|nr:hypothetical protein GQ600_17125 [Phytophthora cactorum]